MSWGCWYFKDVPESEVKRTPRGKMPNAWLHLIAECLYKHTLTTCPALPCLIIHLYFFNNLSTLSPSAQLSTPKTASITINHTHRCQTTFKEQPSWNRPNGKDSAFRISGWTCFLFDHKLMSKNGSNNVSHHQLVTLSKHKLLYINYISKQERNTIKNPTS